MEISIKQVITLAQGVPVPPPDPTPARPPLWRVKHDIELGRLWRPNLPEVHPFFPNHHVPFTKSWQLWSFSHNTMDVNEWTNFYDRKTAFTNEQGFGIYGDPRANWVKNTNTNEDPPKVEALCCGGALLTGYVSGTMLVVTLLNGRDPAPNRILEPWEFCHAVTVDRNGTPRLFPQGDGLPVIIPLLADTRRYPVLLFPLEKLERWTAEELPNPYKIYSPWSPS